MGVYKVKPPLIIIFMLLFFSASFIFKDVIISELLALIALISCTVLFRQISK